ncbi:MAG TPA: TRAP transporter large permease subunit [Spirochaetia bacterium]|nr:TRAP transporter large permease subunit [Spirochaetia bacterium]
MGGWVVAAAVLLAAFAGAPLFAVIAAAGLAAFVGAGTDPAALIAELYRLVDFPALIAIPLFTFAGYLLAESQAPRRLVALAQALFGWLPGGFAVVAILSTTVFTAFSGASGVTIIALGGLILPALLKQGYPKRFSLGLMTTSGSLGLLFPPSLPIILYSIVAGVSIDRLFVAGLIPGIVLVVVLAAYSIRMGLSARLPRTPFRLHEVGRALKDAAWELPLPFLVIGGIYAGVVTAAEAAALTAVYLLIVEVLIRREITFVRGLARVTRESMVLVGAILVMLGAAMGITSYVVDQQIPMKLFALVSSVVSSRIVFLVILNVFLLVMNMVEIFSAIIIVVPIIVPVALQYGVDPVHLGIIFLLNLEIGYMTPPLGLNLFLSSLRFGEPLPRVYRSVLPFFGLLAAVLLVVTYFPGLSLALGRR